MICTLSFLCIEYHILTVGASENDIVRVSYIKKIKIEIFLIVFHCIEYFFHNPGNYSI